MQKMVVAGLAAALLTGMRHALCLWLTCAPLLTSTPTWAPHALRSSQPIGDPATLSLSASQASVPERALPLRAPSLSPLALCSLVLASPPPHPLFPQAGTHQIAQVFWEALVRVHRQRILRTLQNLIPSLLSLPVCRGTRAGGGHPSPEPLFFFLCPPNRLWLLGCAWQETSPGGRVCQPGSRAGGLERKLAPPHGLSPLPHPCRLEGGQAASRLLALSTQPRPALPASVIGLRALARASAREGGLYSLLQLQLQQRFLTSK